MPLRMIDWQCPRCTRQWEVLTNLTADGQAAAPRCPWGCAAFGVRIFKAPAIRTNDNGPRDQRVVSTAGHPMEGQTVRGNQVWDSQLGKETAGMSAREIQRYCEKRGIVAEPERAYTNRHLSYEPPPPRLEDDPAAMRESIEDASDMFDRWEAGKLPEVETPMLDQDAEARAHIERMTTGAETISAPGDMDE
jgi:hypothetical protein